MNSTIMARETMIAGVKLNYCISEIMDGALTSYCEQTGRNASDVIRQLLSEFIDGDRQLSTPAREVSGGIRSNMMLPARTLDALDLKISAEGHGTRGGVISRLLCDFLENRVGNVFGEILTIEVDRQLYNKLYSRAKKLGKTVEQEILDICHIQCAGE